LPFFKNQSTAALLCSPLRCQKDRTRENNNNNRLLTVTTTTKGGKGKFYKVVSYSIASLSFGCSFPSPIFLPIAYLSLLGLSPFASFSLIFFLILGQFSH